MALKGVDSTTSKPGDESAPAEHSTRITHEKAQLTKLRSTPKQSEKRRPPKLRTLAKQSMRSAIALSCATKQWTHFDLCKLQTSVDSSFSPATSQI